MKTCLLLVITITNGMAFTSRGAHQPGLFDYQIVRHNINNVEMSISNYGMFGQTSSGTAGCWWPKGSGQNYIFGAGLWFGTVDSSTGDTLVTIGYGPHGGEHEFGPGLVGWPTSDPDAIIYITPGSFPPPKNRYPMAPEKPISHQDSWCAYNDADINYHMAGDTRPIGIEVYQIVYAWNLPVLNDAVYLCYAIKNVSGHKLTKCFVGICTDCDIGNESGTSANDFLSGIVGQWYKYPGSPDSIWVDNIGYQWQEAPEGGWTPEIPGVISFDLLQTPFALIVGCDRDNDGILDQYERDSAYFAANVPPDKWDVNANAVPDWRDPAEIPQLGMTALKRFTLNLEPNKDNERYLCLAGYNFKTGLYEPYDTMPPAPDDQRFLMGSGPFDLEADSTLVFALCVFFARWDGLYMRPDSVLVPVDYYCQLIYDRNWLQPCSPPTPSLYCMPQDKKVTLIWNNISETTIDPYYEVIHSAPPNIPIDEPYYLPYDFQGFRIWKSQTARAGDWTLLATSDKADGVTFTYPDQYLPESLWINAIDNGIVHSFVDTDVRNGFKYYYAVTAFDRNYLKGMFDSVFVDTFYVGYDSFGNPDTTWDYDTARVVGAMPLTFESGPVAASAVPRREAANYVPPGTPVESTLVGAERLDSLITVVITSPMDVDPNQSLYVVLSAPEYRIWIESDTFGITKRYSGAVYRVMLKDGRGLIVDSLQSAIRIGTGYDHYGFSAHNGLSVVCDVGTPAFPASAVNLFEAVDIPASGYPDTLVFARVMSPVPNFENAPYYAQGFWAYRGHDYAVTWHAAGGKSRTVTVVDANTGDTIPFYAFKNDTLTAPNGACWCFSRSAILGGAFTVPGTDTLEYRGTMSTRTKSLYIMGGMINLKKGLGIDSLILPADGEVWTVMANDSFLPPSVCGTVVIHGQPGYFSASRLALNVKVVPNPYMGSNEWQQSSLIRRLKFINLPNQCTIRVFNLNGELVKTLLHRETIPSGNGAYNNAGGDEWWNLLNEFNQLIACGIYVFHVESNVGEQTGKFAVIR